MNNINRELAEENNEGDADFYGVTGETLEADSDVNEDRNRERQLDEAFQDWVDGSGLGDKMKDALTREISQ
jgi:hypothetical protein